MDAKELQLENERLRKLFSESQDQLARVTAELEESKVQHQATTAQFSETLQEKDRRVAALEHQIKLLLQKIRGSRQERIDPDQLLLFSMEELQQLADELNHDVDDDTADEDEKDKSKRKRGGRRRLPENLPREIRRYELSEEELVCPGCGELRQEFDVASSEQLETLWREAKLSD